MAFMQRFRRVVRLLIDVIIPPVIVLPDQSNLEQQLQGIGIATESSLPQNNNLLQEMDFSDVEN